VEVSPFGAVESGAFPLPVVVESLSYNLREPPVVDPPEPPAVESPAVEPPAVDPPEPPAVESPAVEPPDEESPDAPDLASTPSFPLNASFSYGSGFVVFLLDISDKVRVSLQLAF
jgi:hypothetical protein